MKGSLFLPKISRHIPRNRDGMDNSHATNTSRPQRLLSIQAGVAFIDNFAKFALLGLVANTMSQEWGEAITSLTAALLIIPFIGLAPLAAWLCRRYTREQVIHGCLRAQVITCGFLFVAGMLESIVLALVAFGLLACQSACFSPAKQAIIKEWVGPEKLGRWVAWMGLSSVLGILLGGAAGGFGFDALNGVMSPYAAFSVVAALLSAIAVISFLAFYKYRGVRGDFCDVIHAPHSGSVFANLMKDADLRICAVGIASFYAIGGFILVCLSQIARSELPGNAASAAGVFAACLGVGFVLGSVIVGQLQKLKPAVWITPLGCGMIALGCSGLSAIDMSSPAVAWIALAVIGFAGAGLVLPMQSMLQLNTDDQERGPMISAVNAITNISSISLLGVHTLANENGFSYRAQIGFAAIVLGLIALYFLIRFSKDLLVVLARLVAKTIYRVRPINVSNVPAEGGVLLVANHLSWADAVIVYLSAPRDVKFMGSANLLRNPMMRWVFDVFGVIPVSPTCARQAIKSAKDALEAGECVCIFPEGGISQTGMMHSLKKGSILIARQAKVPVVAVSIDRIWGSVFSYADNRFFKKIPRAFPFPVDVNFGAVIAPKAVSTEKLRDEFSALSHVNMENRIQNAPHIAEVAVKNLKQAKGPQIIDRTIGRREVSPRQLLILTELLRKHISQVTTRERIAAALPMSAVAMATNLGAVLAGKTPVFLNTTTSSDTWKAYAETAQFDVVLTVSKIAKTVREKCPEGVEVIEIDSWLKVSKFAMAKAFLKTVLFSAHSLCRDVREDELTVLFTSGSSGTPKGVHLSPKNVMGNCYQVKDCAALRSNDRILANLPPFHSFGYTMGCWMPLISGNTLITTPNPLDARSSTVAIKEEKATLLMATPTFLRPYLRKSSAEDLASLRAVIAGAERLPETLQDAWEAKFNSEILLGYGMTEASPVISLNVPDPEQRSGKEDAWRAGKRKGSSGRLLPGIRARLLDPESGEYQYGTGRGVLEVQGANVSQGYLDNSEANAERFRDGWLHTGDIVSIDEDGFLFIEGRVSRFAKIGGEMVPLDAVEKEIETAFSQAGRSAEIAICAVADEQKGEKLILFTEEAISGNDLRGMLAGKDIPNLWIPREVEQLESLPKLASGKINYAEINKMAKELGHLRVRISA